MKFMIEFVKIIASIGLCLNTTGTILVFVYGISPLINKDGRTFLHNPKEHIDRQTIRINFEQKAKIGIWLCVVGNLLQVISLFFV